MLFSDIAEDAWWSIAEVFIVQKDNYLCTEVKMYPKVQQFRPHAHSHSANAGFSGEGKQT